MRALRMVLAITGGGSRAIADLLEVPGGSRTLLEAVVPYSAAALGEWLGAPPEHYCSAQTARAMAVAAFLRAKTLSETGPLDEADLVGIACTASLASDRPKRGPHRIHVAWQRISAIATHSIELVKGRRSRAEEEELAAWLILDAVAEAAGIADRVPLGNSADEPLVVQRTDAPAAWQDLLRGTIRAVRHEAGSIETAGRQEPHGERTRRVMFPGHSIRSTTVIARWPRSPPRFSASRSNLKSPLRMSISRRSILPRCSSGWRNSRLSRLCGLRGLRRSCGKRLFFPIRLSLSAPTRSAASPTRNTTVTSRRQRQRPSIRSIDTGADFSSSAVSAATVSHRLINLSCQDHYSVFAGKSPPSNSAMISRPPACAVRTKNERGEI